MTIQLGPSLRRDKHKTTPFPYSGGTPPLRLWLLREINVGEVASWCDVLTPLPVIVTLFVNFLCLVLPRKRVALSGFSIGFGPNLIVVCVPGSLFFTVWLFRLLSWMHAGDGVICPCFRLHAVADFP